VLTEPTMEKIRGLGLTAFAAAWSEQQKDADVQKLTFDERLGLLVDAEWLHRENKRLARLLRAAKLKIGSACVEDIDYPARRELEKSVIRQLATCRWIDEHQNVVITGMTGTGKTYVACALAQQACRKGFRAVYRRATRLKDELTLAHADGTYTQLLGRFARADVLVIDGWGLAPPEDQERPRPPRDPRGPLRHPLHDHHEPGPALEVARPPGRPDYGRRDLRPRSPQRSPHRAKGPVSPEGGLRRHQVTPPASLRSVHDGPSERSRCRDLSVHDGRNPQHTSRSLYRAPRV
jgi:hypothetical protein